MSERASNVVEALALVMAELPAIGKDSTADPRQGGYAYRGIEQITQHAQPLFAKHGVLFVPHVREWDIREIVVNGKPWTDTIELIEYTVYGPGGVDDHITVGPILAIGRDNSDKGANKCMTQAFKYALLQSLVISDAKDDGDKVSVEADHSAQKREPQKFTAKVAYNELIGLLEAAGVDDHVAEAERMWKALKPQLVDGEVPRDEWERVVAAANERTGASA